jgi:phosphonate transport system ATP-binding protein
VSILEIKDLCHAYNGNAPVLRGVSFTVEPGEFLGVIGLSGSGKSTLLRSINRLIDPASGEIWVPQNLVSGTSNTTLINVLTLGGGDLRHLRRKIGMIFQQFNLAKRLSVIDNVLAGALGYQSALRSTFRAFTREERCHALINLKRVGLLEHAYKRADELSGGEQQRVAIARSVANRPAIVLADEPTGSLDSKNSEIVLNMFRELNRKFNQTIILVTHNPELVEYTDRLIEMRDGVVVSDNDPVPLDSESELTQPLI